MIDTSRMNAVTSDITRLQFFDCDLNKRMKISTILKVAAELAGYDYTQKGFSHEFLWENEMVFLLSRISIKIHKYPSNQDILTSSTWECGKKGAMFLRGTDIVDENGQIMVEGISGWILTNPITRHIYKPSAFKYNMPQVMDREVQCEPLGKISYGELTKIYDREVRISDIDANGHVYNGHYADIAMDAFSQQTFYKDVENFRINFISEAKLGDIIEVFSFESDDRMVVIGKVGDNICFETEFMWK